MRHPLIALTCFTLVVSVSLVMAKEMKQEKPMDMQTMMETYQKLAIPGEPHKLFASLTGRWVAQTKEWMEPGKPPTESNGSSEMKMLLGGRVLQQEFTGSMMGQPYSGFGINAYDNLRKKYVSTWINNMSTGIF